MEFTLPRFSIVTDLGFGDSGKGITIDFLASHSPEPDRTIVIRMSSGHQVGHTVQIDGKKHVFSNMGSGTLRGVPTYYSEHTVMHPTGLLNELESLKKTHPDINPSIYYHPLTMVATPYDIACNQALEIDNGHGSVGVGYGTTMERNRDGVHLYVKDLYNDWVLKTKLDGISYYYTQKYGKDLFKNFDYYYGNDLIKAISRFPSECENIRNDISMASPTLLNSYHYWIFEGNQGVLLDCNEGFYPNNTWADCTSKPALDFLKENGNNTAAIFYVTRSYCTRHGNGPMPEQKMINVEYGNESNVYNRWQGAFRKCELDMGLLDWAVTTDRVYHPSDMMISSNFVITCLDQLDNKDAIMYAKHKRSMGWVLGSYSPESCDFRLL